MKVAFWTIGLIVTTVVPLVIYYVYTRKTPHIVYVTSSPIPVSAQTTADLVQEIQVKNIGNVATNVTVRVNNYNGVLEIKQSVASDSSSLTKGEDHQVVDYEQLKPNSSFSIIAKGRVQISEGSISVLVPEGDVSSGLEKGRAVRAISLIPFVVIPVIYLLLMLYLIGSDYYRHKVNYAPQEILVRNKPWFLLESSWKETYDRAAEAIAFEKHDTRLKNTAVYHVLSADKPSQMSDIKWQNYTESWSQIFCKHAKYTVYASYRDEVVEYPSPLPKNLSSAASKELEELAGKRWALVHRQQLQEARTVDDISKLLRLQYPDYVDSFLVSGMNHARTNECMRVIIDQVFSNQLVLEDISEEALDSIGTWRVPSVQRAIFFREVIRLGGHSATELATRAIEKDIAKHLPEREADSVREMFERMVSTSHDESAAKLALSAIKKILLDIRVEEANLESLSEELRQTILTKQDELLKDREKAKTLADESAAALAEYQEELAETLELKQKVTNQLDIISEIFNNPDIIKSIEAYNVPFAEGNWENLCRLAEMLQDSRE